MGIIILKYRHLGQIGWHDYEFLMSLIAWYEMMCAQIDDLENCFNTALRGFQFCFVWTIVSGGRYYIW